MHEQLAPGSVSNTFTERQYHEGGDGSPYVVYKSELSSSVDPDREAELLKALERRTTEEMVEPGVVERLGL